MVGQVFLEGRDGFGAGVAHVVERLRLDPGRSARVGDAPQRLGRTGGRGRATRQEPEGIGVADPPSAARPDEAAERDVVDEHEIEVHVEAAHRVVRDTAEVGDQLVVAHRRHVLGLQGPTDLQHLVSQARLPAVQVVVPPSLGEHGPGRAAPAPQLGCRRANAHITNRRGGVLALPGFGSGAPTGRMRM